MNLPCLIFEESPFGDIGMIFRKVEMPLQAVGHSRNENGSGEHEWTGGVSHLIWV
jgi:hypothetical protein